MRVYIDTNIFLNVWFREVDPKTGKELWRFSAEFLKRLGRFESFTSRNVLFEVKKVLGECMVDEEKILKKIGAIKIIVDKVVKITKQDRVETYRLMDELGIEDVFDARNAAVCKRINAVLVSRDRELASKLTGYIRVAEPEELL
ncbi:MAG: type II toxin-antitoxin system VapC family toxin [Candidatus Bathycorpusculaceae bacterium]